MATTRVGLFKTSFLEGRNNAATITPPPERVKETPASDNRESDTGLLALIEKVSADAADKRGTVQTPDAHVAVVPTTKGARPITTTALASQSRPAVQLPPPPSSRIIRTTSADLARVIQNPTAALSAPSAALTSKNEQPAEKIEGARIVAPFQQRTTSDPHRIPTPPPTAPKQLSHAPRQLHPQHADYWQNQDYEHYFVQGSRRLVTREQLLQDKYLLITYVGLVGQPLHVAYSPEEQCAGLHLPLAPGMTLQGPVEVLVFDPSVQAYFRRQLYQRSDGVIYSEAHYAALEGGFKRYEVPKKEGLVGSVTGFFRSLGKK